MNELDSDIKKRNVAYKLRIGDILKARPVMSEDENRRMLFVELGDKKISRVNVIANLIEKYISDNAEKKYASLTIDDASGQIKLKAFGDEVEKLKNFSQGDTLQIIGMVREYNNELYIIPEVVKGVDTKWLLVRKLEIQKSRKDIPISNNAPLREVLLDKIRSAESDGGIEIDNIIMNTEASPEIINQEIKKLLEEGLIYEPRPGKLRYLG
jgi:hypothetical protein